VTADYMYLTSKVYEDTVELTRCGFAAVIFVYVLC